jgi:Tol biopolymer transport system component
MHARTLQLFARRSACSSVVARKPACALLLCAGAAMVLGACAARKEPLVLTYPTTTEQVQANEAAMAAAATAESQDASLQGQPASGVSAASALQQLAMESGNPLPLPGFAENDVLSPAYRPATSEQEGLDSATFNVSQVTFADEGAIFDPCVAKDGTTLVLSSTQHRATSDIYVQRAGSRTMTQLTRDPAQDMMPKLSPDGTKIAFSSDRSGNWDIYVMPVQGGKAVQVTTDAAHEIAPSWSPDGTQLVYCRLGANSARWEMWTLPLGNPNTANFIGFGLFPQWSPVAASGPDGSDLILYQLGRERGRRGFGIWTIQLQNGEAMNPTQIASAADRALINPSWSPDGKWIVFAEVLLNNPDSMDGNGVFQPPAPAVNQSAIRLVSAEGDGDMRVTFANQLAVNPVWGSNNRLYFVGNQSGTENIWSLDMSQPVRSAMMSRGMSEQQVAAGIASIRGESPRVASEPTDATEQTED